MTDKQKLEKIKEFVKDLKEVANEGIIKGSDMDERKIFLGIENASSIILNYILTLTMCDNK